jgi:hypothetical protein
VDAPEGPVQTVAIEIEGGMIQAMYVVRNPDKSATWPARQQRTSAVPPEPRHEGSNVASISRR